MLIEYDDDLKVIPRLAESWEQSADNMLLHESFAMPITAYPDIDLMKPNVMDLKYFLSTATSDRNIWLS